MKQHIHILTLGVDNLERSMHFFRDGLGWQTQGIVGTEFEHGAVVFFNLDNNMILSIYERKNLAWDSGLAQQPGCATDFSIGHLVPSDEEVDRLMLQAQNAGATIVKPAQQAFWGGYAGYFKDIDGHLWEIAHNPALDTER